MGVQGLGQQRPDGVREEAGHGQGDEDGSTGDIQDPYLQLWDRFLPSDQGRAHRAEIDLLHSKIGHVVVG